MQTRIFNSILF